MQLLRYASAFDAGAVCYYIVLSSNTDDNHVTRKDIVEHWFRSERMAQHKMIGDDGRRHLYENMLGIRFGSSADYALRVHFCVLS